MDHKRATFVFLSLLVVLAGVAGAQEERASRPPTDDGPTKVRLAVIITDVSDIDDVGEVITLDFSMVATWHDPRLAWEPEEGVLSHTYEVGEIWTPRLVVLNARDLENTLPEVVDVDPDGNAVWLMRLNGDLGLNLDLQAFPLDRQAFQLNVIVVRTSTDEVELVGDERSTLLPDARIPGWSLGLGEVRTGGLKITESTPELPHITWTIDGQREVGYYIWTMFVPLTFIVFMAWTVFWIHPSLLPPMVGVATASAFSLIAYRTALRLSLPKVAYMTRADVFILGSTALVFSALGVAIASNRMMKMEKEASALRLQRTSRLVYVGLFVVLVAISLTW